MIGAIVGGGLGYIVGNEMDKYDQQQLRNVLETSVSEQSVAWVNPNSRKEFQVTTYPAFQGPNNQPCRQAEVELINRPTESITGCRNAVGNWVIQEQISQQQRLKLKRELMKSRDKQPPHQAEEIKSVFPLPPPKPSASAKIPSNFLLNKNDKTLLKNVAGKLENSFSEAGYSDIAYYRVPDGFALVSKLEQINSDGTPKDPRWSSDIAASRIFNLTSYIKALFTASPGQYRIISFVVTSKPFVPSSETIKREEAMAWLDNGMKELPSEIGEEEYTNKHYCTALIYEFEQPGKDKEPFFKDSSKSRLSGKDHLEKSSLWSKLEK